MNKKEILMQPNNIIKGKYTCTAIENKLFYKILFNAQKQNKDSSKYTCVLTRDDFCDVLKNNNDLTEKNISDMLLALHQTILEFDYMDSETNGLVTYKSGLIGESKYKHDDEVYEITLHETLYKHITDFIKMQQVGNGYTPLNLDLLFKFKGAYTQRLYTFFRVWSRENKTIEVKYKLEELRHYLKLQPDMYPEYKVFKQKLLKRAIKEINEKGNMTVDIKDEIRKNRKVHEIVFLVTDHEQRKYFEKNTSTSVNETKTEIKNQSNIKQEEIAATAEVVDFYVPNRKLFTVKTLSDFINDFKDYDFKDAKIKSIFFETIALTLEKDNEEKIKAKSYNYFKVTLLDKLSNNNNKSSIPTVKTRFHNINQTFNKYSPDELEKILQESQKGKFK